VTGDLETSRLRNKYSSLVDIDQPATKGSMFGAVIFRVVSKAVPVPPSYANNPDAFYQDIFTGKVKGGISAWHRLRSPVAPEALPPSD